MEAWLIFSILSVLLISSVISSSDYRQELPVKLLNIRSMASRYPASDSEFRIRVEKGYVSIFNSMLCNLCNMYLGNPMTYIILDWYNSPFLNPPCVYSMIYLCITIIGWGCGKDWRWYFEWFSTKETDSWPSRMWILQVPCSTRWNQCFHTTCQERRIHVLGKAPIASQGWWKRGSRRGIRPRPPPDFGRIEGAAEQIVF